MDEKMITELIRQVIREEINPIVQRLGVVETGLHNLKEQATVTGNTSVDVALTRIKLINKHIGQLEGDVDYLLGETRQWSKPSLDDSEIIVKPE